MPYHFRRPILEAVASWSNPRRELLVNVMHATVEQLWVEMAGVRIALGKLYQVTYVNGTECGTRIEARVNRPDGSCVMLRVEGTVCS